MQLPALSIKGGQFLCQRQEVGIEYIGHIRIERDGGEGMGIVVVKSPKFLRGFLRRIFKMK